MIRVRSGVTFLFYGFYVLCIRSYDYTNASAKITAAKKNVNLYQNFVQHDVATAIGLINV